MALNIKNQVAENLARELADTTGESLTDAVIGALRNRLTMVRARHARPELVAEVAQIQALVRSLPDRDTRHPDEILGYDAFGLPG